MIAELSCASVGRPFGVAVAYSVPMQPIKLRAFDSRALVTALVLSLVTPSIANASNPTSPTAALQSLTTRAARLIAGPNARNVGRGGQTHNAVLFSNQLRTRPASWREHARAARALTAAAEAHRDIRLDVGDLWFQFQSLPEEHNAARSGFFHSQRATELYLLARAADERVVQPGGGFRHRESAAHHAWEEVQAHLDEHPELAATMPDLVREVSARIAEEPFRAAAAEHEDEGELSAAGYNRLRAADNRLDGARVRRGINLEQSGRYVVTSLHSRMIMDPALTSSQAREIIPHHEERAQEAEARGDRELAHLHREVIEAARAYEAKGY
jgi:hypothetical protein